MDSDAHPRGRVVVVALARDGPAAPERREAAFTPTLITPGPARTGPTPKTSWSEALEPRTQESLSALIGALSLRAVRSQHNS